MKRCVGTRSLCALCGSGRHPDLAPTLLKLDEEGKKAGGMKRCVGTRSLDERDIGAVIELHRRLRPGLLESVYEKALRTELEKRRLAVQYLGRSQFQIAEDARTGRGGFQRIQVATGVGRNVGL